MKKYSKAKYSFVGVLTAAIGGGLAYFASSEYLSVGADITYVSDGELTTSFVWVVVGIVLLFVGIFYLILVSSR